MKPRHPVALVSTLPCVVLAMLVACGPDGRREFVQTAEEHALEEEAREQSSAAPDTRNGVPPEIYYDLTRYDWYRRGQPLLVGGRPYQATGRPEPTLMREFKEMGRYEGVTYYVVEGSEAPPDVVYVPVSPGYWQPFVNAASVDVS